MSFRETLAKNPKYVVIGAAVALGLAALLIYYNGSSSNMSGLLADKWMYDLNTQQIVRGSATTMAPGDSGSGSFDYPELGTAGALVDAAIFTCGDPTAIEEGMTISDLESIDARLIYVVRQSPKYIQAVERGDTVQLEELLGVPDGSSWHSKFSPFGMQAIDKASQACPDGSQALRARP